MVPLVPLFGNLNTGKIVAATVAVSVSASTYASASALTSNAAVFVACVAAAATHGGKIHCRLLVSID